MCILTWTLFFPLSLASELQVGLVYDNLIVGYGRFIGDGQLLKALSQPRFFLHEVALPLMILVTKLIGESNGVVNAGSTISRLLW